MVLVDGALLGYLARGGQRLLTFLPPDEPMRSEAAQQLAAALAAWADRGHPMYLQQVDDGPVEDSMLAEPLAQQGFVRFSQGYQRKSRP